MFETERISPVEGRTIPAREGGETILVVEDEEEIRALAEEILRRKGYVVLKASGGEEALRLCGARKEPIHLLLTDVVMPGMSGRELAERMTRIFPGHKVLFMSGYTEEGVFREGMAIPGADFLQKPFTLDALAHRVRMMLDASP